MSQNLHLIPLSRKSLAPLRNGASGSAPQHAFLVDEHTFWIGRDFPFLIQNRSRFPRWYRLVITNLQPHQEYLLYSHDGRLQESRPLEVAAGEEAPITLTLGGEDPREPEAPKVFEVYVQEYGTADERGQPRELLHEQLTWIPRPNEDSLALRPHQSQVRVRPWQRRVGFDVSLVNRSYLPVTVVVRALPADGKEAGELEGTQQALHDPIPPQQEQPIRCEARLPHALKTTLPVRVEAEVEVAALELERTLAAAPVQLVPVPLLKVWYDWVVAALLAFLLLWALFGMPPWVHPSTRVVLTFPDGLPANVKPQDLQLTLTPYSLDGSTPTIGRLIRTTPTAVNVQQNQLIYDFDWKPMWRGFRWTWRKYPLQLAWGPNASSQNMNALYPLPELDHVSISSLAGVSAATIPLTVPPKLGVNLLIKPDLSTLPRGEDIVLTILANGMARSPQTYVEGQLIALPDDTTSVEVTATTSVSNLPAHWVLSIVKPQEKPYLVPLSFGANQAIVTIPSGTPPAAFTYTVRDTVTKQVIKRDRSDGDAVPIPIPMRSAHRSVTVDVYVNGKERTSKSLVLTPNQTMDIGSWSSGFGSATIRIPAGDPPAPFRYSVRDVNTQQQICEGSSSEQGTSFPITMDAANKDVLVVIRVNGKTLSRRLALTPDGKADFGVWNSITGLDPGQMMEWCKAINLAPIAPALVQESTQPDALRIAQFNAIPDRNGEYQMTVTANKLCWIQVYWVTKDGNVQPWFGNSDTGALDEQTARPIQLNKMTTKRFKWDKDLSKIIILACKRPKHRNADLQPQLQDGNAQGWTIAGIPFPSRSRSNGDVDTGQ